MSEKNKKGRPTKYDPEYHPKLVLKLCRLGATDKQIADCFDVCEDTITEWKKVHLDFSVSIKKGKDEADAEIANSLYYRAKGYSHKEEKIFQHNGEIIRADTIKHYPPDTTAGIFWLKNRQSNNWRDRREITGADGEALVPKIEIEFIKSNENKGS